MKENPTNYACNLIGAILTAIQPDEILKYISLALTILATIISIAFTIYKWYNNAKKDGKITKKEVKGLFKRIFHLLFKRKGEDE